MKDFNQQQQDFVNSMGHAFRSAKGTDSATFFLILVALFIAMVLGFYTLHQRWHWVRGKWIFIQKYLAGRASSNLRKSKNCTVTMELPYGPDRTLHTITEDLSPTGMFVRINPPLKKGELFRFVLTLTNEDKISATAEVKWAQNRWTEHHASGNGCRFLNLSEGDQKKIQLSLQRK